MSTVGTYDPALIFGSPFELDSRVQVNDSVLLPTLLLHFVPSILTVMALTAEVVVTFRVKTLPARVAVFNTGVPAAMTSYEQSSEHFDRAPLTSTVT